jgi:hypothetical protein
LLQELTAVPEQLAAVATFMNENIKTIKPITLNLLTNFMRFPLEFLKRTLCILHKTIKGN